ncbi:MAG: hypothetical protein HWE11_05260 [Gammaproteobacteria bacterium]|nr:hypothetical protein [Gammaproteobacteria bacterium]
MGRLSPAFSRIAKTIQRDYWERFAFEIIFSIILIAAATGLLASNFTALITRTQAAEADALVVTARLEWLLEQAHKGQISNSSETTYHCKDHADFYQNSCLLSEQRIRIDIPRFGISRDYHIAPRTEPMAPMYIDHSITHIAN